jgi:hypothetical protein
VTIAFVVIAIILAWCHGWDRGFRAARGSVPTTPRYVEPERLSCFGGPFDGAMLQNASEWSCIQYAGHAGHCAVSTNTAWHLKHSGSVIIHGFYHRNVDRFEYRPLHCKARNYWEQP